MPFMFLRVTLKINDQEFHKNYTDFKTFQVLVGHTLPIGTAYVNTLNNICSPVGYFIQN